MLEKEFIDINFPEDIAYGAVGGPEFFTEVVSSSSGFEKRNINWREPRNKYNLAPAIKTSEQLDSLIAFFRIMMGRAHAFRFKDWADFNLKNQIVAVGNGVETKFQLIKKYNYGSMQVTRKITKPILNTLKILCGEKETKVNLDPNTGLFTFENPPEQNMRISASCEFDVPVRFDCDYLATTIENYGVYSHHEIPLIEVKL